MLKLRGQPLPNSPEGCSYYDFEDIKIRAYVNLEDNANGLLIWLRDESAPAGFKVVYQERHCVPTPTYLSEIEGQNRALEIMQRALVLENLGRV